jgi:hypothetical protein
MMFGRKARADERRRLAHECEEQRQAVLERLTRAATEDAAREDARAPALPMRPPPSSRVAADSSRDDHEP